MVVGLHRLDLPEHLADIAADIGHPVLTQARQRAHPPAENQDRRDHERQRQQHDATELGVGDHQQHAAADQHDQVAQRHRQRGADHRLQQRGIGGQA